MRHSRRSEARGGRQEQQGEQFASVTVELIPSDQREVRNEAFIADWERRLHKPPGLEYLTITSRTGGHPGRDLEVRLSGQDANALKRAALELSDSLAAIPGVLAIEDDMPYGQQQLVFRLSPLGESLGLSVEDVGRQLRGAFDGELAQIFNEADEEVEVRVMLPDTERYRLSALEDFSAFLPNGQTVPLLSVVDRLIVINFGQLLAEGAPDAVMADPKVREVYLGISAE